MYQLLPKWQTLHSTSISPSLLGDITFTAGTATICDTQASNKGTFKYPFPPIKEGNETKVAQCLKGEYFTSLESSRVMAPIPVQGHGILCLACLLYGRSTIVTPYSYSRHHGVNCKHHPAFMQWLVPFLTRSSITLDKGYNLELFPNGQPTGLFYVPRWLIWLSIEWQENLLGQGCIEKQEQKMHKVLKEIP